MATKTLVAQQGFTSKVHLATNAKERVIKIMVTDGTKVDCKFAFALIKDIKNQYFNRRLCLQYK